MAPSTKVVQFPWRFYLLADNKKFVARSKTSQAPSYKKYYAHCDSNSADAPQNVFEVLSSKDQSKELVTLRHVETGQILVQTMLVWMLPVAPPWTTYFRLEAVDIKNNKAAIYVTLDDPSGVGRSVPQNAYLVRQNRQEGSGNLPDALSATGKTISEATIFTFYDSALKKVWTELVFDFKNAKTEDVQPFETGADVLDNSDFDQTVTFHPSISYSQSIESNWNSSSTFGFNESISVSGKVPYVGEVEVGFTAEQSFTTASGGSSNITKQRSATVDVPVLPHKKVQVFVVGTTGKVTIPFQHKEIATYSDNTQRERVLYDGICRSVSSTGTYWKVKYVDDNRMKVKYADDNRMKVKYVDDNNVLLSGKLLYQ